ncbi:MAG: N-acetylmuramoyl-L-alanine amidase [Eubacteriales bacterium]|nr:N-acetylmuramoyl-L-alanine amidase [Eubacteriales bacterium]
MKIGINCGHTLTGPGHGANGLFSESTATREVGNALMEIMRGLGAEIVDCTIDQAESQADYLADAVTLANQQDLDWFISIHFNASANHSGYGCEVYTYEGQQHPEAITVCKNLERLGFANRGVKAGSGLYVIRKTKAVSMLIEVCFCDNEDDVRLYHYHGPETIARAISEAFVQEQKTCLLGDSVLTERQITQWMVESGNDIPSLHDYLHLPQLFLEEGMQEGIRGDLAFCQAIKETGYFKFNGDVIPEQHNYAGLGTTGGGVKGCYFPDDRTGVRAQIQHLKAYATAEPLKNPCVDPRYDLVSPHGKAPYLEDLAGKWAVPGYDTKKYPSIEEANRAKDSYGYGILNIFREIQNLPNDFGEKLKDGLLYANIAGFTSTAAECKAFQDFLGSHGMKTESWIVKPVTKIE